MDEIERNIMDIIVIALPQSEIIVLPSQPSFFSEKNKEKRLFVYFFLETQNLT